MSSPSLTIHNFTINDIGSYRCSARNSKGTAHSPVMAFIDIPKCNISVSTISTVTGVEGHNVTLICNVSSIYPPAISVIWKFNDTAIDTLLGGKYQGGSISAPSLFVTNLSATDQGNYACSAINVFSTRQAYVYLTLADLCDCACGTYYDCTPSLVENPCPCTISLWKVAITAVMLIGALLGIALLTY